MKQTFVLVLCSLIFVLIFVVPQQAYSQSNASFDVEVTSGYNSVSKVLPLSGNRTGIIINDGTNANTYLQIYNSSGTQTANVNITSQFNWTHTNHGAVTITGIPMNNGNIFIAYSTNSNSTGIQTYEARYVIINESGAQQSAGQLNTIAASGSYIYGILLDKLSDGKIVAVWRRMTGDNLTFRLFNTDGTAAGNDTPFSGQGTSNSFSNTYTYKLAAGRNGNFMVSVYFWNGGLRGFAYNNSGVNIVNGGADNFMVDPSVVNNYGNYGLVALPNGNFAAAWSLSGTNYIKTMSPDGTAIVDKQSIASGNYSDMMPSNTSGSEGFILTEMKKENPSDMGNPNYGLFMNRYNQSGVFQTSGITVDGYMIQPTFIVAAGLSGGYVYVYSFYKSFTLFMGMAMGSGDTDIKGTTVGFSMSTLPVSLISYDAKLLNNNTVQLTWKTASETSSSHFKIERSTDGRNFISIGGVAASGTISAVSYYSFTDIQPVIKNTFYRLKQFDIDGRAKDLGVRLVKTGGSNALPGVYPNPAQGNIITLLAGNEPLPLPYRISDVQGRVIKSGTMQQSQQEVDIQDMNKGIYFLQIGGHSIKIQR